MNKISYISLSMSCCRILLLTTLGIFSNTITNAQQDCPPLTVFCQDLHTAFMQDACMVEVWAKDFIPKINDAQTSLDDFIISFDEHTEVMSQVIESTQGSLFELEIWITSRCDTSLKTKCIVILEINDNSGLCPTVPCPVDPNPWCGYAVVTCTTVQGTSEEFTGHTAAIIDTRKNSRAPRGDSWTLPVEPGKDTVDFIRPEAWRINKIGNVYGIALNPSNGDIFLGASDVYDFDFRQFVTVGPPPPSVSGPAGPGGIYRANFANPELTSVFVSTTSTYPSPANFDATVIGTNILPNTGNDPNDIPKSGNGIGNIDYGIRSNHLFASNLEDGKLYSINATTGIITDVYDPFTPYVHSEGIVKPSERLWGVQVRDCGIAPRLYFARSTRNPSNVPDIIDPKEIWSIAINLDGTFAGVERIELIVGFGDMSKITDLAFNSDCNEMLVAERGNAHSSEIHRYMRLGDGSWVHDRQFYVGRFDTTNITLIYPRGIRGNSSAGGVSFGPIEENCVIDAGCDNLIWGTTNCGDIAADDNNNPPTPFECRAYGAQGIDSGGNELETSKSTDIFVGFDTDFTDNNLFLKSNIGDVELFNCCCPYELGRNVPNTAVSAMIAGEIYTESKFRVHETNVSVSSEVVKSDMMTDKSGAYFFEALDMHQNYQISPSKTGNITDGLSTLDLVLIQRHILNINPLDSPYKIVAADINNDHRVSVKDMILLRRLILGLSDGEDLDSWNFIPAAFKFDNVRHPFPFSQVINLNDLESNEMHEDFIAIKKGDVNGDNQYNIVSNQRNNRTLGLSVNISGDQGFISFDREMDLAGLQFQLKMDVQLLQKNISDGILNVTDDNFLIEDNSIKFSWVGSSDIKIGSEMPLFHFKLTKPLDAENIQLIHEHLSAQAYDANYDVHDLALNVKVHNFGNTLLGNHPNPFKEETTITFDLAQTGVVTFEFYSMDGKIIGKIDKAYPNGRNTLTVHPEELGIGKNKMIIYKMKTLYSTSLGKMIILE